MPYLISENSFSGDFIGKDHQSINPIPSDYDECAANISGHVPAFVLFILAVVLIGLFGNLLTILVLMRKNLRCFNSVILIFLAITDSLVLLSLAEIEVAESIGYHLNSPQLHHEGLESVRFFYFLGSLLGFLSQYLIVFALLERLMALCCAKRNKLPWLLIGILGVLVLLLAILTNAPLLSSLDVHVEQSCAGDSFGRHTLVPTEVHMSRVHTWFHSARLLLLYVPPMLFCLSASIPVVASSDYGTRLLTRRSRRFNDAAGRSVAVGVVCAAVSLVLEVEWTVELIELERLMRNQRRFYMLLIDATEIIHLSFSAVKFFVYCLAGELFREELLALFRCRRQHQYNLAPNSGC